MPDKDYKKYLQPTEDVQVSYDQNFEPSFNTKQGKEYKEYLAGQLGQVSAAIPMEENVGLLFEPYGGLKSIDEKLTEADLDNIPEARAQAQSGAEKLSMMLPRIGAKIVTETAKIPGEIVGLAEWAGTGFDIDKFAESVDNAWVRAIDDASNYINDDILSVYKRREVEEGGFWRQITSPEFWATEGADGIGFLAAMMVPGAVLRGAGLGEGIIKGLTIIPNKFGSAGKLSRAGLKAADKVNMWTSAGVNTLVESVAEGAENMKGTEQAIFNKRLDELIATGQYDPQQAADLAQEYVDSPEIQEQISQAGFKTFRNNLAILIGPNILDQKWLFKGFSNLEAKGVIGKRMASVVGKTTDDALESITRLTPKQIRGKMGQELAIGIGKEGFFEEGLQYATSKQQEQNVINPENTKNLLETYVDALSDTDMQKSIFLGAMLGGVMGSIGGYRSAKKEDEYLFGSEDKEFSKFRKIIGAKDREGKKGVIDVFKNNFVKRYQSVNDLYKTKIVDGREELELDENNNPIIDSEKITKYGTELINDAVLKEQLKDFAERGDKEGYEYLKSILDFQYMVPFVTEDGGYELLQQHINNLAEKDLQELSESGMYEAELTNKEVKQDLLEKAKKVNSLVKKADSNIIKLFSTNEKNNKYARGYFQELYDSYISSEYQKDYIKNRLGDLSSLSNNIINESTEIEEVNTSKLAPGDIIILNGEKQQVLKDADDKLQTINLDGKLNTIDKSSIENNKVENVKNVHPVHRDNLAEILVNINNYNKDLEDLTNNQEKLFTKQGQQKGFEEYANKLDNIIKEAEKIPAEDLKKEVAQTETIEDLQKVKDKIIDSKEVSDKNKKDLTKETEAKIRDKEVEQAKLNKTKETPKEPKPKNIEEEIAESEVEITLGEETTEDNLAEIHDELTEEPEYDLDRKQEGKEDKLNASEDQLAESEFKTTYVNVAYLAIEYNEKEGTIRSKLDANKKLIFNKEEHSIPSIPDEYEPGTKIIMYVYAGHDDYTKEQYEAYKDDVDNIPIAIQKLEDYEAGKQPFMFVHKMNWITPNRVAEHALEQVTEETKALREFVVKSGKVINFTTDKSGGWKHGPPKGTKNPLYLTLREVIGDDTRPIIGFGNKLGNLDANIEAENSHNVISGIPYLVLPRANNTNFAVWLKQEPIKNNPNFEKYTKTVTRIFEEYVKDSIDIKSIQELRVEIGKYFHVNTDKINVDELLANEKKDYIFRISINDKGQPRITLYTSEGLQDYYYIQNKQDNWNWVASKKGKTTTVKDMAKTISNAIPNKYPNITKKGVDAGSNFEVYELDGDNLVKNKKDYIDFLSENRVVTSTVQPRIINGVRTYFSQPNIRINTDISKMEVLETKVEEKTTPDLEVTEKIPTFEELFPEGLPTDINIDEIFSEQDKKDAEDVMKHCKGTSSSPSKNKKIRKIK